MNLYEMSCPALLQSQVAHSGTETMDHFLLFYFLFILTVGHPKFLTSHVCQSQFVVLRKLFLLLSLITKIQIQLTLPDMLEAKYALI